jgi:hypothetical protein
VVGQADLVDLGSRVGAWQRLENGTLDLVLVGVPLAVTGPLLPTVVEEGSPESADIPSTMGDDQRRGRQQGQRHESAPRREESSERKQESLTGGEAGVDVLAGERGGHRYSGV